MTRAGFPHSDILGSRFVCQLPEAYRRLQRPSSAPSAKASTLCPYKLDHKDHSKRCSRPLCSSQATTGPGTLTPAPTHHTHPKMRTTSGSSERYQPAATRAAPHPQAGEPLAATLNEQPSGCSLRTQQRAQPTPSPAATVPTRPQGVGVLGATSSTSRPTVDVPPSSTVPHSFGRDNGPGQPPPPMTGARGCQMLLRKEVIQPHLPVRLPCYDLVPIASPTFDSSLSYELGHWLRVLPTFVT